jgi:hypothetical protein
VNALALDNQDTFEGSLFSDGSPQAFGRTINNPTPERVFVRERCRVKKLRPIRSPISRRIKPMKTMSLFVEPPNTPFTLRATPNDGVLAFLVFLRRWTPQGPLPLETFQSDQLETGVAGALGTDSGYDFILKAQVKPQTQAAISIDLQFQAPGQGGFNKPVSLPTSEGPVVERVWKVIIH